jgi:hypothetical protein
MLKFRTWLARKRSFVNNTFTEQAVFLPPLINTKNIFFALAEEMHLFYGMISFVANKRTPNCKHPPYRLRL